MNPGALAPAPGAPRSPRHTGRYSSWHGLPAMASTCSGCPRPRRDIVRWLRHDCRLRSSRIPSGWGASRNVPVRREPRHSNAVPAFRPARAATSAMPMASRALEVFPGIDVERSEEALTRFLRGFIARESSCPAIARLGKVRIGGQRGAIFVQPLLSASAACASALPGRNSPRDERARPRELFVSEIAASETAGRLQGGRHTKRGIQHGRAWTRSRASYEWQLFVRPSA